MIDVVLYYVANRSFCKLSLQYQSKHLSRPTNDMEENPIKWEN